MLLNKDVMQEIERLYTPNLDLAEEFMDCGRSLGLKMVERETTFHQELALAFLARATDALFSVHGLFSLGMAKDATSVMRTIVELVIDLRWLGKERTQERMEQMGRFEWLLHQKFLAKLPRYTRRTAAEVEQINYSQNGKPGERIEQWRVRHANELSKIEAEFDHKSSWAKVGVKRRAADVGLGDLEEWAYVMGCEASHSGPGTLKGTWKKTADGGIHYQAGAVVPRDAAVVVFACSAYLDLIATVVDVFNVQAEYEPKVGELRQRMMDLLNPSSARAAPPPP